MTLEHARLTKTEKRFLTWAEFDHAVDFLSNEVATLPLPASVLALARGGLPLATAVAHRLDIRELHTWRAESYTGGLEEGERRNILTVGLADTSTTAPIVPRSAWEDAPILVIDDVADTGETLAATVSRLRLIGVPRYQIITATWVYKPRSRIAPDRHVLTVPNDQWVVFPWEHNASEHERLFGQRHYG